ncbi:MAG: hypothetical protein ACRYG7_08570 [Janthinobacterium lividum]
MKQRLLLLPLLLLPGLAHAYAGGGHTSVAAGILFVLIFLAPFVLPPVLLLWAYLRPRQLGLQLVQGLVVLGCVWLWSFLQYDRSVSSMGGGAVALYFEALLPLALLLNGLTQARQANRWQTRLLWTGAAITGGYSLLQGLLMILPLGGLMGSSQPSREWLMLGMQVLRALSSWVVVLRLLRQEPALGATLWHAPWWRTPVVVSSVGAVYALASIVLSNLHSSFISTAWEGMPLLMLYFAAIYLLAGLIALRLVSPLAAAPEEELGAQPALTEG